MSTCEFPSLAGRAVWPLRLASAALWIIGLGVLLVALSGPLTRLGVVKFGPGLMTLAGGGALLAIGILTGAIGWIGAAAKRVPIQTGAVAAALVVALLLFGYLLLQLVRAFGVPPIHEISTDLADPPAFVAIRAIRAEIPGVNPVEYVAEQKSNNERGSLNVPDVQRQSYPDIQPLVLQASPAEAFARAERVARELGWEIQESAPAEGRLEATATTTFFGFKDDVVVRVRSAGAGSRVDVRSKSRVGLGDAGANAKRVRAFLAAMQQN
ncbi:MAG TPA: DUF1499 domain-containing protein [Steroidobacteraceae bacterium]|nr:DUF1499 domain-containing protein [Steroidobacteraceae bacterium]